MDRVRSDQNGGVPGATAGSLFAEHRRGGRFFVPWGLPRRGLLDVLRWKLGASRGPRRPVEVPRAAVAAGLLGRSARRPALTWIGHATFALRAGGRLLLTDPHFGPRALLPARRSAPGLPVEEVPERAVAILSHDHYDHLDAWTLARLPRSTAWAVPLGLGGFVRRFGYREVIELDWWQSVDLDGFRLTALPAQHWSRRLGAPENSTLWASWAIEAEGVAAFFAGDTGYFHGFAELARHFPRFDAALLPIGAYEPRWFMAPVHMNPAEALRAGRELGARRVVAMHWGAFELADEALDEPPRELARRLAGEDADLAGRVAVPAVGETIPL